MKKKHDSARGFQAIRPMPGPNAALTRRGKTAADRARQHDTRLSGKSRAEVLAALR
jgi:hypothetical protein